MPLPKFNPTKSEIRRAAVAVEQFRRYFKTWRDYERARNEWENEHDKVSRALGDARRAMEANPKVRGRIVRYLRAFEACAAVQKRRPVNPSCIGGQKIPSLSTLTREASFALNQLFDPP